MTGTISAPPVFDGAHDGRTAFSEELIRLAENDERIVAVCNDSVGSSRLVEFGQRFPDRLLNVGIAEQDLVGVAAGLANGGLIPFASAAAPFLTGRALEQIKTDVAYSDVPVILCGQAPGMAYGELGPTHHSIEDLSWMRAIANLTVVVPADRVELRAVMRWAVEAARPVYVRIPRFKVPDVHAHEFEFQPGRAATLVEGDDIAILATGTLVSRAIEAALQLRETGIAARVINCASIEPLDRKTVLRTASECRAIITAEEATTTGGLGAAVASLVSQHDPTPMRILGIDPGLRITGFGVLELNVCGNDGRPIVARDRVVLSVRILLWKVVPDRPDD
jgi:transketolase